MRLAFDAAPLLGRRTGIGHYAATLLDELLVLDPALTVSLFAVTRQRDTSGVPRHDRLDLRHVRFPARVAVTGSELLSRAVGGRRLPLPPPPSLRADVVHGTNYWVPVTTRGNGVVTVHDLTFLRHPEMCTAQVRQYRWVLPQVLRRCAVVLTPSETVREQVVADLGFPADRVVATPLGVRNVFGTAAPDPALQARLGVGEDYLLFVGAQEPRKNLERLLAALALVPSGLQLVLAGPPGWGAADLPALARELGVADRVVLTGYLSEAEVGSLVAGALAFVFPSLYEGFGLPPLEAMAAGVPVVAARAGSLPEVLGDAPFWCDPLDVASIAAAMERAAGDGPARAAAVRAGRARAAAFDWARTAALTREAYGRV